MSWASRHAVVVGGSIAGLVTAQVLSRHFGAVTVIEKDGLTTAPGVRKGVPQGSHVHGLQGHALTMLESLYPGIKDDLVSRGAVLIDFGRSIRAYLAKGWAPAAGPGARGLSMTRPLLEQVVLERTLAAGNVTFLDHTLVKGVTGDGSQISGIRYLRDGETGELDADLIIDASGRGSRFPGWLEGLGFPRPDKSRIHVDVRYATCLYERPAGPEGEHGIVVRHYPMDKLGAALLPVEEDQWLLSLSGRFGVYPGKDHVAFLDSAQSLVIPDVYDLLAERRPTTEVSAYTFSHNEVSHFDAARLPRGYVPVGDTVIALNPLYGQGMTSAIFQACLMDDSLKDFAENDFHEAHLSRINEFSGPPWKRAVLGDTIFNEASGDIPDNVDQWRQEERDLAALAASDKSIANLIFQVAQFAEPASRLDELIVSP